MDHHPLHPSETVSRWTYVILLAVVQILLLQTFHSSYYLRHFKIPILASISRIWRAHHVAGGTMHLDLLTANQKYDMSTAWWSLYGESLTNSGSLAQWYAACTTAGYQPGFRERNPLDRFSHQAAPNRWVKTLKRVPTLNPASRPQKDLYFLLKLCFNLYKYIII